MRATAAASSFAAASETLDAVVETTEKATSAILSAAERMQEQAWTLREQGIDAAVCDELDRSATEIYTACGFQDLTAQRIAKAVETLKFLDSRIRSLVEAAGLSEEISEEIEDIDATIAMEMETARTEPDIWMSEANQTEIDETFDFFVPAEKAEPTMVGADLMELEEEVSAVPAKAEITPPPPAAPPPAVASTEDEALFDGMAEILAEPDETDTSGPSPLESLDGLPARDRLRAFR